jgi:ABC-2 type transport system ATP-binding protein
VGSFRPTACSKRRPTSGSRRPREGHTRKNELLGEDLMSEVMIEAQGLTKRYGPQRALDNATFNVSRGEIVGFLGPNGAGKSTTMKILTCFIAPTEGSARVAGCDIWSDPIGVRRAIGYLPESTPLYTEMLVAEYLEFMGNMRGLSGPTLQNRIKRVVEETQLESVYAKEIRQLSKGFKQRVGLAQALIHEPPILILDEPLSGLDPNQMTDIRDLIREIGRSRTIIFSTHNLSEIALSCTRAICIANGRLVFDATPQELESRKPLRGYSVTLADTDGRSKAQAVFGGISGVSSVQLKDDGTIDVLVMDGRDVRAEIARAASAAGLTIIELVTLRPNLYEIFRELTLDPATAELRARRLASDDEDDDDDDDDEEDE